MKKKNAIMLADTRPALVGNLLLQIKATNGDLFDEALIYYDEISEEDKKIMNSIMPCKFIKFDYEIPEGIKKLPAFTKFTSLMFSRYYMFDLLNSYETITWIDTDVLICGRLDSAIEKAKISGMAANFEDKENKSYKTTDIVRTCFKTPLNIYNMTRYNMSSGFIVVSDSLRDYNLMTEWCFEKTIEYADYLTLPDQGILNILIQEFDINVASVGEKGAYCFYPSYKRNPARAKIVHAWGSRKFWNSWYLYKSYPEWNNYYEKWLALGGSNCFEEIKPAISVVIPMYKPNLEYFNLVLRDLLISQTQENGFQFDNFEVILVVDGDDNDGLIKLVEKYNDPRVNLIINKERAGIAKSLNIGIREAKGEFIARVDDDDRVNNSRLYKQYMYLKTHERVDLVTSNFEYFGDMNEERISFEGTLSHAWSIFTCPFNHPTIMFRKRFFVENDLYYDESRSHVEDWELWLRCFNKGMKVGNIPEVLYYHRWHNGSAGQNQKTIDMMRELVRINFEKLDVKLTEDDLKIVAPWNGKVDKKSYNRLIDIFDLALKNNKKKEIYNSRALRKAFEYRLFEAENGYINDIVIKKNHARVNVVENASFKQKVLGPFYRVFKRVMYNIVAEAINDNLNYFRSDLMSEMQNMIFDSSIYSNDINYESDKKELFKKVKISKEKNEKK